MPIVMSCVHAKRTTNLQQPTMSTLHSRTRFGRRLLGLGLGLGLGRPGRCGLGNHDISLHCFGRKVSDRRPGRTADQQYEKRGNPLNPTTTTTTANIKLPGRTVVFSQISKNSQTHHNFQSQLQNGPSDTQNDQWPVQDGRPQHVTVSRTIPTANRPTVPPNCTIPKAVQPSNIPFEAQKIVPRTNSAPIAISDDAL
jgi:hypothetical protein